MIHQGERSDPDLAILVVASARAIADRMGAAVAAAGYPQMRPRFGFVIRALGGDGLTLTELADRLGVTKQAAIKVVDEMEALGFVERRADPADRRAKPIALTERGLGVRAAALHASERIEADLRRGVGGADVDAMRRAMLGLVGPDGGLADVLAGRARPVW
jgi:DNA-binding MarR family transcriptional regulator